MTRMTEMSKEYATAIFMLACENEQQYAYKEELETVLACFKENPEYCEFLASPGIPLEERLGAIERAFTGNVSEYTVSFLQLLCEKGRIRAFGECVKEYKKLLEALEKTSVAKVTSAVELSENEIAQLKTKLEKVTGHTVITECSVDGTLIGGITVEIDGKILDGSVRQRLYEVKEVMSK